MAHRHAASFYQGTLRVSEWVLGVVGVIGAVLGLFILFAGDDQYVGLGGEASWRVGDIASAWAYGLLGAGIALVLAAGALVWRDRHASGTRAGTSRTSRADLLLHATVFALVNTFLWIQDFAIGGGLNYAYWITIPWGIGLALHAASAFTEDRRHQATGR